MHVKGTNLKVIKPKIIEIEGLEGWEKYLEILSEPTRNVMDSLILPSSLYDKSIYVEANRIADFLFGDNKGSFIIELGKISAKESVFGLYNSILGKKLKTPQDIIKIVPAAVMPKIFAQGRGETVSTNSTNGTFRIGTEYCKDDEEFLDIIGLRGIGWVEGLLSHAGAINPKVKHTAKGLWNDGIPYFEIYVEWE